MRFYGFLFKKKGDDERLLLTKPKPKRMKLSPERRCILMRKACAKNYFVQDLI
jgi:hypothetical protein